LSTTPPDSKSFAKVVLKRADIGEIVRGDEVLRAAPFVKAMGATSDALLKKGLARRYPDRAVLFQQGEEGNSLFMVLRGEVRLSGRKGSDVVELGVALRGEVFGESEVLSGARMRANSAVAQGDLEIAEFPREALLEHGEVVRGMAEFLRPIQEARLTALSEMTDFMNRW
jgi:CRP-like cAMP-binding protein